MSWSTFGHFSNPYLVTPTVPDRPDHVKNEKQAGSMIENNTFLIIFVLFPSVADVLKSFIYNKAFICKKWNINEFNSTKNEKRDICSKNHVQLLPFHSQSNTYRTF